MITACLAWYDEPVWQLEACVLSLEGLADRLLAVDGAYELVNPDAGPSPDEQHDAIRRASKQARIRCEITGPEDSNVWVGQVEKRDAMMKRAAEAKGSEWLLVVDADYVFTGRKDLARKEFGHLAKVDVDAVRLEFYTPIPEGFDLEHDSPHEWHSTLAGRTIRTPLVFWAWEGFRVERRHWFYSVEKEGERVGVHGCHGLYPPGVTTDLRARMVVHHNCFLREQELLDRNRDYCRLRDAERVATGFET